MSVNHNKEDSLEFLSSSDVANLLHCSTVTARNTMKRADFPLVRIGKNMRVLKSAFLDWAKKRRV